jgi:outer membrane receptor protein involved in Fe transport
MTRPPVRRLPGAAARRRAIVCCFFLCFLLSARGAQAQTASMTGLVTDPDGLVVPGASVSVTSTDRGVVRSTATNDQGYYTVGLLSQGSYTLQVTVDGFKSRTQANLHLDDGQVLRMDVRLEIGSNTETVSVTGARPAVETETSSQSTVIAAQRVRDMPLNGRNPMALAALVPGVRPIGGFGGLSNSAYGDNRISISGGSPSSNNVMVDGTAAENHTSGGLQVPLSPDATEEVRIITRNAAAEFGRTGGGIINIISKSGGNAFRGGAWEFLRDRGLSANDFFSNRTGKDKVPFKFNQYGATFGGPLVHDRTFFFANWEGVRQRTGTRQFFTVPTALQRQGDFSQTFDASGRLIVIYDPLTTRPDPARPGRYIRDPFPGNVIPRDRLNSVALNVGSYYPEPNTQGAANTGANNYQGYGNQEINKDLIGLRIDHYFTPSRRLFGRHTTDNTENVYPLFFGGNVADPSGAPAKYPRSSTVINYSDAPRANLLIEARAGLNRFGIDRIPRSLGFDVTALGLPAALNTQTQFMSFPYFTMSDISPIGQNQGDPSAQRNNSYTAAASATWITGGHTIKAGGELRAYQWNSVQGDGVFRINVTRGFTTGPDPNTAGSTGYGYASFLLGNPESGTVYRYNNPTYTTKNVGLFVQDDWKVSPRLTLNLGLRWEHEGPTTDRHDAISNFDPSATTTANGLTLTGGMIYPGVDGLSRGNRETSWTDFGPRAGLAYQLRPGTVVRSAYGLFYLPTTGVFVRLGSTGFATQTSYIASTDGGLTPAGTLSNPYPQGILQPTGSALGALTGIGTNVNGNLRSLNRGYSQQWDVDIQQPLAGSWVLVLGYMGNLGRDLPAARNFHYLPASALAQGSALQQQAPNPYASLVSVGALAQPTVPLATLLYNYPQFTAVTGLDNFASSTYHGATVRLERRFSGGLSLLTSYTFSKLLDTNLGNGDNGFSDSGSNTVQNWENLAAEKALSTSDQPHRLVVSGSYALPFGRSGNRLYTAIAGGWQLNAIATFLSGNVIAVTANAPAYGGSRPNVTGEDPSVDNPTVDKWLNRAAFTNIAAFTYGDAPRNLPHTRTQPLKNVDASLFKTVRFTEACTLQFRLEAFNLTNTTTFGTPVGNINDASFGMITSLRTNTAPRQIQLGVKLSF